MKRKLTFVLFTFLLGLQCMVAQTIRVTGVVISEEDGEPIIGASVIVKGSTIGNVTDIDGKFTLDAVARDARLLVSYVGMKTLEVAAQPNMRITLAPDIQALDEIMVVAYGTAKKSSFTGSATAISNQQIEKRPLTNIASALEGTVSGVQTTSSSGQPGSAPSIRIRGFGSYNASNAPIYVVDGAIFNGSLESINPTDIDQMTVLKDAASTSLYGSSAGNGVVLITTKRAKQVGTNNVTLNITQGFSQRGIPEFERVNVWEYYPLQWEAMKNGLISGGKTAAEAAQKASDDIFKTLAYNPFKGIANNAIVGTDGKLNPNATTLLYGDDLDWEGASQRTGHRQEYNLSYSTKTDKSDTYASLGYLNEKGYIINTGNERYSGRINYNLNPTKWFKTGMNISVARTIANTSNAVSSSSSSYNNIARFTRVVAPIYPIHMHNMTTGEYVDEAGNVLPEGQKVYEYINKRPSDPGRHVIAETYWNLREYQRDAMNARTYLEIQFMEGLKGTVNGALETGNRRDKVYENPKVGDALGSGRMNITSIRSQTYMFNELLQYDKTIGAHTFDILVGHENTSYTYEYMYGMRRDEILSGMYEFPNFINISSLDSYTDKYNKEGYLGRINYNYNDRYYASASYRHDGSSRFHPDHRWGDFFSFGASWRIDQEDFMENLTWINNLKLRASYGETGNDGILYSDGSANYYAYQTIYSSGLNNKDEAGLYFNSFGNTKLKWETQKSTDVAVEFGLFDRLNGTIEYFQKASDNLLFNVPTPTSSGTSSIPQNIGKLMNKGLEVTLDYTAFRNKDWTVAVGLNATHLSNKFKKVVPEEIISGTRKITAGHGMYDFWLRQYAGVNPDNGDALYIFDEETQKWADTDCYEINGQKLTKTISKAKYDFSGSAIPDLYGGFNLNIRFRSFELAALFSYGIGGKILNGSYQTLMDNTYGYAKHVDVKKAWKKPGDITNVPRLDNSQTTNFDGTSTRFLTDADYLTFRSLTFAYNLPKSLLQQFGLSSTRLTVSGENLFQLNKMQGLNVQANFSGNTYNEYAPARTITFGLNVSF